MKLVNLPRGIRHQRDRLPLLEVSEEYREGSTTSRRRPTPQVRRRHKPEIHFLKCAYDGSEEILTICINCGYLHRSLNNVGPL